MPTAQQLAGEPIASAIRTAVAERVRRAVATTENVDCFHPANLGRLVAGEPRVVPATPAAVRLLLAHDDVPTASAASVDEALTPVPGGVGPVTLATLLENVVLAAERRADGVEPDRTGWPG